MTALKRVELPSNFGVNVFNMNKLKGGKFSEIIYRFLNPFNVLSRLKFRAAVDIGALHEIPSQLNPLAASKNGSLVAYADKNLVRIFSQLGSYTLEGKHAITCLGFITDRVLVTGNINGDIEVFNLTVSDPIYEAKCVYKFNCGSEQGIIPVLVASDRNETTFQVVLNRGKCMLIFDTIACVSGNTDESEVSPTIVDLLQDQPVIDGDCLNDILATVSLSSVFITDSRTHKAVSFNIEAPARCIWASDIGHLFIINQEGEVIDCAWSEGLVGVSTFPKSIKSKPASVERAGLVVDPQIVDIRENRLVTVENNDLFVYSRKQTGNDKQYPVSPIVSEFDIEKQLPIRINPGEEVVSVRICDAKTVCVITRGAENRLRAEYVQI